MMLKTDVISAMCNASRSGFVGFSVSGQELLLKRQKVSGAVKASEIKAHRVHSDLVRCVASVAGNTIAVIDLAPRLGLPPSHLSQQSCFIFAQALGVEIGVIVDEPPELLELSGESLEAALQRQPGQGSSTQGVVKAKPVLVDLDILVGPENLSHLQAAMCESASAMHDSRDGESALLPVAYTMLTLQSLHRACGELSELWADKVCEAACGQSQGVDHVTRTISQLEQITHVAAANAQERPIAVEEMTARSERLRGLVEHLQQLVNVSTLAAV